MPYSKEQKLEAFKKLSEADQEVIVSPKTADMFEKLSREYELSPEESSILSEETALVLLGLEPQENFVQKLTPSLKKDREQIVNLASKVRKELFTNAQLKRQHPAQPDTIKQQYIPSTPTQKPEYLVRGGWKPEHVPDIKSVERPISSSLIKKQVEKRKFDESADGKLHEQKPKPYQPDPYRESLD